MPRKKTPPKFKYTCRQNGSLFVRFPLPDVKFPVWRKCPEETQEAVDLVIEQIKSQHAALLKAKAAPAGFTSFCNYFLFRFVMPKVSRRTYDGYHAYLKSKAFPFFKERDIREITNDDLQNWINHLIERKLSPLTVWNALLPVRAAFARAFEMEIIKKNPAKNLILPKKERTKEILFLNRLQARKFVKAAGEFENGIILIFALETGMRPEEYLALRWSDISLENAAAFVNRAVTWHQSEGGGFAFVPPKTKRSRRSVPLSSQMIERLTVLKESAKFDLVFPSKTGTPVSINNLNRRLMKDVLKKAELSDKYNLYSLRHSTVSLLLQAGINIKIISERLGHSNISITLETYSHLLPSMNQAATDKISSVIY